ncbi:MAG: UDP-N-acetylglucosamine--N-acetylmuramyl-(pentapeptide) pyrophosphoryl-undecaprenol N-acetylglucosamine transferase [Patescibacteria group bacterium]
MSHHPRKIRVALTGGGTAGHIYPLAAVGRALAENLTKHGLAPDIRFFGDPGPYAEEFATAGIRVSYIPASKWRRYFDIDNFFDIFNFIRGVIGSFWKLFFFMPHVCFSKGGPGALAVLSATRFYNIPIVLHESDAVPGLTNRITAKSARLIELAFPSAAGDLKVKTPMHVVGNPVRPEILGGTDPRAAKIEFGFDPEQPVVLVIGGSQGAERINAFILEHLTPLTEKFQILHQTGTKNFETHHNQFIFLTQGKDGPWKNRYRYVPYFKGNLKNAYEAADIVISRAGAGSLFELAALGKPAILVPLPESANNHQVQNAYQYEKAGAGIVLEEENFLPSLVLSTIEKILNNPEKRAAMAEAAQKFATPNSAEIIAEDILRNVLHINL